MEEKVIIDSSISLDLISQVYKFISEIPYFTERKARINAISPLPGGLTNYNFKVTIDNHDYAVRIAGPGTAEYLNRPAEKYNAGLMSDIKVNPKLYYYDEKTGSQVVEYINGKTLHIEDFQNNEDYIKRAAKVFYKYHNSGHKFSSTFDPLKESIFYKNYLLERNEKMYDGAEVFEEKLEKIAQLFKENPPELAPCHNDPLCENWLDDGNLWLIDWEYGGMNMPMFDLGALVIEARLNEEQEKLLLREYYGGEINEEQYSMLIINKFLCDALWSYWAVLQIATGKDREFYWQYGLDRFERAFKLIDNGSLDKALDVYAKMSKIA